MYVHVCRVSPLRGNMPRIFFGRFGLTINFSISWGGVGGGGGLDLGIYLIAGVNKSILGGTKLRLVENTTHEFPLTEYDLQKQHSYNMYVHVQTTLPHACTYMYRQTLPHACMYMYRHSFSVHLRLPDQLQCAPEAT